LQIVNDQIQHEHLRAGIKQELDRRKKIAQAAQVLAHHQAGKRWQLVSLGSID
jgi:hypothetical protein